mgnify:CR=1 FL=1
MPRWRALALGALELALAGIRSYPLGLVAMWGAGFASIAMMTSANTSIQLASPDRLRGRVMSVYTTVFAGSTPIGAPIIGWLASAWSTEVALVVGDLECDLAGGLGYSDAYVHDQKGYGGGGTSASVEGAVRDVIRVEERKEVVPGRAQHALLVEDPALEG